jgi:hypothetical protein
MADRYWIAIAGDYSGDWGLTTNWATSAGATVGGASVPTASDNVFFDFTGISSDTDITFFTYTGVPECLNFYGTGGNGGYAINLTDSSGLSSLNIYGTVSSTIPMQCGAPAYFYSTTSQTLACAIVFSSGLNFLGSGSYWTLGATLSANNTVLSSGVTLDTSSTGNYQIALTGTTTVNSGAVIKANSSQTSLGNLNVLTGGTVDIGSVCSAESFSVASGGTLNMGSAVTTINSSSPLTITSGATFTPTTGQITFTNGSCSFLGYGYTYNTLLFSGSPGTINISNVGGLFNAVTFSGTSSVNINSSSTFNGAVVFSGSSATNLILTSSTFNSSVSINKTTVTTTNIISSTFNGSVSFGGTTATNVTFSNSTFNALTVGAATTSFQINGTNTLGATNFNKQPDTLSINGASTFSSLAFTGRATAGVSTVTLGDTLTVTGYLNFPTNTPSRRIFILSSVFGTQRTLSAGSVTLNCVDFQDIIASGATFTGVGGGNASVGDAGGNSNITFAAGKTVYWRSTASAQWSADTSWSLTSGGTATTTAFPLAQDTTVFPAATYPSSGSTVTIGSAYNIGTIDMSLRTTNTMTLAMGAINFNILGNFKFGTGITITSTGIPTFCGRNTQQITTAAKPFATALNINSPGGTVVLLDSCSVTRATTPITLNAGTLDLNGRTLSTTSTTSTSFTVNSSTFAKNVTFNAGNISLTSSTNPFTNSASNFTTTAGTGSGNLNFINGGTFTTNSAIFNCTLNLAGGAALTVTGDATFSDITNTYKTVGAASIKFSGGSVTTFTAFNLGGTSANNCTLASTTTTPATLKKGATWYVGANSTNVIGNTGLTFTAGGGIDWLNISYITGTTTGVNYLLSLNEDLTAADINGTATNYLQTLAEAVTQADANAATTNYLQTLAENLGLVDLATSFAAYLKSITENLAAADFSSLVFQYAIAFSEALAAGDTETLLRTTFFALSEAISVDHANAIVSVSVLAIAEGLQAQETCAAAANFVAGVAEAIQVSGAGEVTGGWIKISDAQTPNWQNIASAQSAGWSTIDTGQTPTWAVIPNT